LLKNLSRQPQGETVRPVFAWTVGKNTARGSTPPNPNLDLPNHSTDLNKTLGILGTPHEESIAKFNPTKTRPKRRNQGNPTKSTSNRRTQETPKIEHLYSRIWEGNHSPKNHEGFPQISPINPQEKGPENNPKKSPREGSENHHQEQPGKTHPNLEEPRRIIYT
jgi:hypothetical protein